MAQSGEDMYIKVGDLEWSRKETHGSTHCKGIRISCDIFEHQPVYRIRASRSKKEALTYTYSLMRWPLIEFRIVAYRASNDSLLLLVNIF